MDFILGNTIGFYLISSLFMYGAMLLFFNTRADTDEDDPLDEIDDTPTELVGRGISEATWATVYALTHVVAFAFIAMAITLAYTEAQSGEAYTLNGAQFHTGAMVWAWLIAAAFAGASLIAYSTANAGYLFLSALWLNLYQIAQTLAAWLAQRLGLMVDPQRGAGWLVRFALYLVWCLVGAVVGSWAMVGVGLAFAVFVAGDALNIYKTHQLALAIKTGEKTWKE